MSNSILERLHWTSKPRMSALIQASPEESALVCIAMIADYYGLKNKLPELRRQGLSESYSQNGFLKRAAQADLSARAVEVNQQTLKDIRLPCVLSVDADRYVVLKSVRRGTAALNDPAKGSCYLPISTLIGSSAVAFEVFPSEGFQAEREAGQLKLWSFWTSSVGLKRYLVQIAILSLFLQLVSMLPPFYTQIVIDESITRKDVTFLSLLAIGFLLVSLLQAALTWFRGWSLLYLGSVLTLQLQSNVLQHLISLPLAYFSKRHVGDIISRYGSISSIQSFLTTGLIAVVSDLFMLTFGFVALLLYSPALTLVSCAQLAIYIGARVMRYRSQKSLSKEMLISQGENSSHLIETIRNITTIKMFGFESERMNLWANKNVELTNCSMRLGRLNQGFTALNKFIFNAGVVVTVYFGAKEVFDGTFTTGMLVAFLAYQGHFVSAGADLVDQINAYKLLGVGLKRLGDIALSTPEDSGLKSSHVLGTRPATLELRRVRFRYPNSETHLLHEVNLTVAPSEFIVIVGASGIGKSTLIRLLLGLERPECGAVAYDGEDISKIGYKRYRQVVAGVLQDDRLFSGTIAENITMFAGQPDIELMKECARKCKIDSVIAGMGAGYQSLIGENGEGLSGGERQRLMLARALYKKPLLLFLDEITSNLDPALDGEINTMLSELDVTRIIVTHRNTPFRFADRILTLKDGQLEQLPAMSITSVPIPQ